MWKKILWAASLGLLSLCGTALAANYPEQPVKLILPYPPGGSFDGPTRILAERLGRATGQPFVVENRGAWAARSARWKCGAQRRTATPCS